MLRATPNLRAMALTPMPSDRWSRRLSAQSSTLIILTPWLASDQGSRSITASGGRRNGGSIFRVPIRGQY